jgi:serine/threonine-protein kinase HipA
MARFLDVYMHGRLVGELRQDDGGVMSFQYRKDWIESSEAVPLSRSLPLRTERFRRKECRGFFAGVLPEQSKRTLIARNLGVSEGNDFALPERIGGECAGAVQFLARGDTPSAQGNVYWELPERALAKLLRELPRRPLMAGEAGVRLSLAGAQDKLAVKLENGRILLPLEGSPSTHILKPAIEQFEDTVFNEALCMRLAERVGLRVAPVAVGRAQGIDYLLVERFDRLVDGLGIRRLHQEDFCQALGIVPDQKYQREGGPSLKRCFALLREVSSRPVVDLAGLLDQVIFNLLVGNNDAHGKNFSLLYEREASTRLAPLYDAVCTVVYPDLSAEMAMKIGGEFQGERVDGKAFGALAKEAGLGGALVRQRAKELAEAVMEELRAMPAKRTLEKQLKSLIGARCEGLVSRLQR